MKRPRDLVELLEELETEITESSVETQLRSFAVIHLEDDETETGIRLTDDECRLLFHSVTTVEQLIDALGAPEEATLTLSELGLEGNVLEALERGFAAVDET